MSPITLSKEISHISPYNHHQLLRAFRPCSLTQAHSYFHRHLNLALAKVSQIILKLNSSLAESEDDRRTAKLEEAKFVPFVDSCAPLTILFMDSGILIRPNEVFQGFGLTRRCLH